MIVSGNAFPMTVDEDPDRDPGTDVVLEIESTPVAAVYGSDQFPCLDDDEREPHDVEALATARRLAALWTAVHKLGTPTENLEKGAVVKLAAAALLVVRLTNRRTAGDTSEATAKELRYAVGYLEGAVELVAGAVPKDDLIATLPKQGRN